MNNFVFFVVLLAWQPNGASTIDSGVKSFSTLAKCHGKTLKFSLKHDTPIELCKQIHIKKYNRIKAGLVRFDFSTEEMEVIEPYENEEIKKLKAALKKIRRWHSGKTKDSKRVRWIVDKALKE